MPQFSWWNPLALFQPNSFGGEIPHFHPFSIESLGFGGSMVAVNSLSLALADRNWSTPLASPGAPSCMAPPWLRPALHPVDTSPPRRTSGGRRRCAATGPRDSLWFFGSQILGRPWGVLIFHGKIWIWLNMWLSDGLLAVLSYHFQTTQVCLKTGRRQKLPFVSTEKWWWTVRFRGTLFSDKLKLSTWIN